MSDTKLDLEIIGAAIGCGAQDQRTGQAADDLRDRGLSSDLRRLGVNNHFEKIVRAAENAGSLLAALPTVGIFAEELTRAVRAATAAHRFPLVVGGDHSCAIGTWSGVKQGLAGDLGLIWLDAHMDSHTVETTETGAVHGMPLAALLGYGDSRLSEAGGTGPKLLPRNLALIGIRSYERGEMELLQRLGVRVFYMNEVETRGFAACFAEALEIVTRTTAGFGISLDLDGIDPVQAPAVGSPAPCGFSVNDARGALALASERADFVAAEIAEFNPQKDIAGKTYAALVDFIAAARGRGASGDLNRESRAKAR